MNQQLFTDHNNTLTAKQHNEHWLKSGLKQSEYCRKWKILKKASAFFWQGAHAKSLHILILISAVYSQIACNLVTGDCDS